MLTYAQLMQSLIIAHMTLYLPIVILDQRLFLIVKLIIVQVCARLVQHHATMIGYCINVCQQHQPF